jgi:hypothetical protein
MATTSPLRQRMIEDMTIRNLSQAPQQSHIYAVIKLGLLAWSRLMNPNATEHRLLLPIFVPVRRPVRSPGSTTAPSFAREVWRDIPTSLKPCARSGCRPLRPGYIVAGAARASTCVLVLLALKRLRHCQD